uniref:BUsg_231 n=1 Tax=uncultured bacterium contig00052 TaxID=1181536 RepID=A0A806KHF2_9BACT|nr:BUsg_231 precursor [uncultured bacterium contig00052]
MFFAALLNASTGGRYWKLEIAGAKIYSESFLIEQLDLPAEMDAISPERRNFIIKLAKSNLDDFYQNNGYFSESINLSITEELVDSSIVETYIFEIYEGEKYRFRDAQIELAPGADSLIGAGELSVPKGAFYDPERISEDQKAIREIYQKNGYLHITLTHFEYIDTLEKKVDVQYIADPKKQVRMGNFKSVIFRSGSMPGQTELERGLSDTAWINELWEIPRDSIIDGKYFFSFRAKLFSTQLFSQVHLEDTLQENGLSDITLTAYERVPGEANYGFFYDQLYGFGISLSSAHKNLLGSFHEFGVGAMLAENKQELSFNYAHPMVFGTSVSWIPTAIRLDEKIFFNHEVLPAPVNPDSLVERWEVANRMSVSFGLPRLFSGNIRTVNTFDFRFLRLQSENNFKIKGEISLIYDRTNNSFDPTRGIRLVPSIGAGGNLENESFGKFKNTRSIGDLLDIGLTHGFTYIDASAYAYYPLHRRLLSAFALSFGNIFNYAAQDDAETFYQGGGRTLRGYRFRSVFPYRVDIEIDEETGEEIGHLKGGVSPLYFRVNEELRLVLPWPSRSWQFVQFIDWARISDKDKSFDAAEEMSVGCGIRYKWQFLTFRLDYALKTSFMDFKPDPFKFSSIVFDLSQAI